MRRRLDAAYQALRGAALDVHDYAGPAFDAAFEVATLEAGLAGVADTLLEGGRPDRAVLPALAAPPRLRGTRWTLDGGRDVDLAEHRALLEHARLVEQVRALCREAAGG